MSERPIIIAYDGSDNANHAIRVGAALFGGGVAHVLHAWKPLGAASSRFAAYASISSGCAPEFERERERAETKAESGVSLARQAGFEAVGRAILGIDPIWCTLCEYVNERRPRAVVMGARGLSGLRSLVAGSVSRGLAARSHVPVLVVPPEGVSAR
jgi:nucleotide-binding universal stress UspA family protein